MTQCQFTLAAAIARMCTPTDESRQTELDKLDAECMAVIKAGVESKDAKIAELTACVLKLQDSLVAAKNREFAAPAPIQSAEVALLAEARAVFDLMLAGCNEAAFGDYQNGYGETIGPRMDALHAALRRIAATPAQTAADVSAPTDEPVAWAIYAENGNCRIWHGNVESAMAWARNNGDAPITPLYARAAAPVSGPSDEGQQGTLSTERIVRNAILGNSHPCADGYVMFIASDEVDAVAKQVARAISAAPVSGQGASIGEDAEFLRLLGIHADDEQGRMRTVRQIVEHIDSRPRSEDSRAAEFSDALRKAFITLEGVGNVGRNIVLKFNQRADAFAVHDYLLKASAIASTPPKADNE